MRPTRRDYNQQAPMPKGGERINYLTHFYRRNSALLRKQQKIRIVL
jgi:hypothetical protein